MTAFECGRRCTPIIIITIAPAAKLAQSEFTATARRLAKPRGGAPCELLFFSFSLKVNIHVSLQPPRLENVRSVRSCLVSGMPNASKGTSANERASNAIK